ncbi:AraC-like ligand-binding domain-containing protein [Caballeronia choica]|nr:helix-turn-helix domain-containing protein [Caballeronia choica]
MSEMQIVSTSRVDPAAQSAIWSQALAERFGGLRIDTYGRSAFAGSIRHCTVGEVQFCRLSAQAHRAANTPRSPGGNRRNYKVAVQLSGHSEFEQDGLKARLGPGDWAIYDTSKPYLMTAPGNVDLAIAVLPQHLVSLHPRERHVLVHALGSRAGAGRMLREFLIDALDTLARAEPPNASLDDKLAHLLQIAIAEHVADAQERPLPTVLRSRIVDFVREHLTDPELSVARIAHGLNCSKRYLHMVFDSEDSTLAKYILQLRLTNICADLGNPALRARSITEVAMKWGFVSPNHFSRTFKEAFGATPREYRAGALQPRPID